MAHFNDDQAREIIRETYGHLSSHSPAVAEAFYAPEELAGLPRGAVSSRSVWRTRCVTRTSGPAKMCSTSAAAPASIRSSQHAPWGVPGPPLESI